MMHWIEKAFRHHYEIDEKQGLMSSDRLCLDALIAAEPKGVRMFMAKRNGGTFAPMTAAYLRMMVKCKPGYTVVPVDVREVEAEEPAPEPKPKTTSLMDYVRKSKTYTEEVRAKEAAAWANGWNARGCGRVLSDNPHAIPEIDPRALAAAKEWFPETPRGTYDKERGDLARIIAKHYEEKK